MELAILNYPIYSIAKEFFDGWSIKQGKMNKQRCVWSDILLKSH